MRVVDVVPTENNEIKPSFRIYWLITAAFIFIYVAAAVILLLDSYRSHRDIAEQRLTSFTQIYRENLFLVMSALDGLMQAVVIDASTQSDEELHELLRVFAAPQQELRTLLILDENGVIRADARPGNDTYGLDVSDRDYFRVLEDEMFTGFFVADPVESRLNGEWSMPISVALRDEQGKRIGAVVASIEPRYFSGALQIIPEPLEHVQGAIINDRGDVLVSIPFDEDLIGQHISDLPNFADVQSSELIVPHDRVHTITTDEHLITHYHLENYPLTVLFSQPQAVIFAGFWQQVLVIMGAVSLLMLVTVVGMRYQAGRTWKIYDQARDIQRESLQRLQAEETVRQSEARYRSLFDNAGDAILLSNDDGQYVDANPAACDLLGYTREEILKLSVSDVTPEGGKSAAPEVWNKFMVTGVLAGQYTLLRKDGRPRVVEFRSVSNVQPGLHLSALRDITKRVQAEEERQKAEQKLNEVARERALIELKQQFIATASHDFRTPLTLITSHADMLLNYFDDLPPEKRANKLRQIQIQVERMVLLMDDVLALSKADAGKLELHLEPVTLHDYCEGIARDMRTISDTHHLHLDYQATVATITIDPYLIQYALVNLISNAFKYSPPGTDVIFRVRDDAEHVIFEVQDHGYGIPTAEQSQLFEPFFRATNTNKKEKGTGLGLANVKNYVELHGGTVTFQSEENVGTTFTIRVPCKLDVNVPRELQT